MNEKIKELIEQATEHVSQPEGTYGLISDYVFKFNKEKFAELIIQECLTAIECGKPEIVSPEMRLLVSEDIYSHWKFYEPKI